MAERKVSGVDILLFIDPAGGTTYSTVVCLTSQSVDLTTNQIDAKTKCGPDKLPGTQDQNVTFEGVTMIDPDALKISTASLFTLWKDQTTIGWKIGPATPVTDDIVYSGTGFIAALGMTWGMDESATFTGELGVIGDITQTITA